LNTYTFSKAHYSTELRVKIIGQVLLSPTALSLFPITLHFITSPTKLPVYTELQGIFPSTRRINYGGYSSSWGFTQKEKTPHAK